MAQKDTKWFCPTCEVSVRDGAKCSFCKKYKKEAIRAKVLSKGSDK